MRLDIGRQAECRGNGILHIEPIVVQLAIIGVEQWVTYCAIEQGTLTVQRLILKARERAGLWHHADMLPSSTPFVLPGWVQSCGSGYGHPGHVLSTAPVRGPDDREAFETLQVHSPERPRAASGTWSSMAPFRCGIWKARTSMTGSTRLGRGSRKERESKRCLSMKRNWNTGNPDQKFQSRAGKRFVCSRYSGGPDGELGAHPCATSGQRYAMPYPGLSAILTDIGTEAAE